MPKRRLLFLMSLVCFFGSCYLFFEIVIRRPVATEQPGQLWMAALKGFQGDVYYMGDKDGYSYFRVGFDITSRYKSRSDKVNVPTHFPLNEGAPYRVSFGMVPQYNPEHQYP